MLSSTCCPTFTCWWLVICFKAVMATWQIEWENTPLTIQLRSMKPTEYHYSTNTQFFKGKASNTNSPLAWTYLTSTLLYDIYPSWHFLCQTCQRCLLGTHDSIEYLSLQYFVDSYFHGQHYPPFLQNIRISLLHILDLCFLHWPTFTVILKLCNLYLNKDESFSPALRV